MVCSLYPLARACSAAACPTPITIHNRAMVGTHANHVMYSNTHRLIKEVHSLPRTDARYLPRPGTIEHHSLVKLRCRCQNLLLHFLSIYNTIQGPPATGQECSCPDLQWAVPFGPAGVGIACGGDIEYCLDAYALRWKCLTDSAGVSRR